MVVQCLKDRQTDNSSLLALTRGPSSFRKMGGETTKMKKQNRLFLFNARGFFEPLAWLQASLITWGREASKVEPERHR